MAAIDRAVCGLSNNESAMGVSRPDARLDVVRLYDDSIIDFRQKLKALPAILQEMNATYTRASTKYVVQDGGLVALSSGQFGTSYDSVTGLYGYMPEPAATNYLTYSNDFSNAIWTKRASYSVTTENVTGPDGAATCQMITNAGNVTTNQGLWQQSAAAGNVPYTESIYIRAGTCTSCRLMIKDNASDTVRADIIVTNLTSSWQRITVTGTPAGATTGFRYEISTNGVTGTIYVGYSQAETGARATTPILTTSGTATRAADVLTVPLYKNTLLYSSDFSQAVWLKVNLSAGSAQPDGSRLLARTSAAAGCYMNYSIASTMAGLPLGGKVYARVKAKAATTGGYLGLRLQGTYPTRSDVVVNLATGAVDFQQGFYGFSVDSASVSGPDVDGFYTVQVVVTTGTTALGIFVVGPTAVANGSWEGASATLSDCYVKEAQVFLGGAAQEFVATSGSLDVAGNANIPGFNSAGYTLFADGRQDTTGTGAVRRAVHLDDGSTNNRAILSANNGSDLVSVAVLSGGVSQASITAGASSVSRQKLAESCAANSFLGALNGSALSSDLSGAMPVSPTTLRIGVNQAGAEQANGFLFRAGIVPQALTQGQINGMTA